METYKVSKEEKIEKNLSEIKSDIDITYYIQDYSDIQDADDVYEIIRDNNGFDAEVIYYSTAISYLTEHDPSLTESLGIAEEFGYTIDNLNSETLASLLKSRHLEDEFEDLRSEINDACNVEDSFFCGCCEIEYDDENEADECCEPTEE